jgi:hypothetical protein
MGAMNNFMKMGKGVFDTFQKMGSKGSESSQDWTSELDKNLEKFKEFHRLNGDDSDVVPIDGMDGMDSDDNEEEPPPRRRR